MQQKVVPGLAKTVFIFFFLPCLFMMAKPSEAVRQVTAYHIEIPGDEIVEGPLLAAGKDIDISGKIDGDVYVFGSNVVIDGEVDGDVLAMAANLEVKGDIRGDLRVLCGTESINGSIAGDVSSLSRKIVVGPGGIIGQDLLGGMMQADLAGRVGGRVCGWGGDIDLRGEVGEEVHFFRVGELRVESPARIQGQVHYTGARAAVISPLAEVTGDIVWDRKQPEKGFFGMKLLWFAAGCLVWYVINLLFPGVWSLLVLPAISRPFVSLCWGIVIFLALPFLSLLLMLTLVGLPLALFSCGIYFAVFYLGMIITGYTLGYVLARRFMFDKKKALPAWFLTSYGGLYLGGNLPVIGFAINISVACWAFGVLFMALLDKRSQMIRTGCKI